MERLTKWNGSKYILPQGRTPDGQSWWRIIADRLAEYENAEEADTSGWVDTRNCVPLVDGYYLVQTVYGDITGYQYTVEGGWNTRYNITDGKLSADSAIENTYVARWYLAEAPDKVPQEWVDEHDEEYRKGVNK